MQKIPCDDPEELLFIRLQHEQVDGDRVLSAAVQIPDWSTNRERFSNPTDVLDSVKYPDYSHIGEFRVGEIPRMIEPDPPAANEKSPVPWLFWAEHEPLVDNYAHSEVKMRKEGEKYRRNKKPNSDTYRKKIKSELAMIIRVRQ